MTTIIKEKHIRDIIAKAIGKETLTLFANKIDVSANHLYTVARGKNKTPIKLSTIEKLVNGSEGRLDLKEVLEEYKDEIDFN